MMHPVVRTLAASGTHCRVLSLCEFRGLETPTDRFALENVELRSLVPWRVRKRPDANRAAGGAGVAKELVREGLRRATWHGFLRHRVRACIGDDTCVAVMPNDAAYPYRDIARLLHARDTPYILVQEGIRFPIVGVATADAYGCGGARAIAAWGETSAAYFRAQGIPDRTIHLTGNPRFDNLDRAAWKRHGEVLRARLGIDGRRVLVYLSNPIEQIGLASSTEVKLELFRAFCAAIVPLLERQPLVVLVKLHGAENPSDFERIVQNHRSIRVVDRDAPLYTVLAIADAAVVLASTAGAEALLFDVPLGVMAIPEVGYAFDYVQEGAALGLDGARLASDLERLVNGGGPSSDAIRRYVSNMFAVQSGSTERVASLVRECMS